MPNSTMMMGFILMGFSDMWEVRIFHAVFFSLMYLVTVLGNFLIVIITTIDKTLHTPMYFFLRNLSMLDMCYISVTVPYSCVNSMLENGVISKAGCIAQVFLVIFCIFMELLFLTIMAHDRYVAICQPLHYPMIMNPRVCIQMTWASILGGVVFSGFHTGYTFRLSFCHSNIIHQFFCDIPSLLKLSCSDTFSNEMTLLASAVGIGGGCFMFIIKSYIHIFSTVLKFPRGANRTKAFSTCIPHILVVSVFLSSDVYVHLKPPAISAAIKDMVFSVLYTVILPLFNPIVYSFRNEQINSAIRKIMKRIFYSGNF